MAVFEQWANAGRRKRRIDAGFQNLYNDKGNWTGGEIGKGIQAGTNMSISAPLLSDWKGHPVTEQEMKNLSRAEALQIYKLHFWDKIKGDSIENQTIANFIADMRSSAGYNGVKQFQKSLNTLGENLVIDGGFGDKTLDATNKQIKKSVPLLNNAFHNQMVSYYNSIGGGTNSQFLKGWLSSLDRDYPRMQVDGISKILPKMCCKTKAAILAASILVIGIIIYFVIKSK